MAEASSDSKTQSEKSRLLIAQALEEFNMKNYSACIQTLSTVEPSTKIYHNVAVAEFYKSDFKNFYHLCKSISQITGLVNNFDSVEIKDADNCVPYFNQAVILYHLQKPHSALKIMKAVMKWMDALEENLLQRAGVLTIHLLLDTNQFKSANLLLEDLQKRWGIPLDPDDDEFIRDNVERRKTFDGNSTEDYRQMFFFTISRSRLNQKIVMVPQSDTAEYSILKGHQFYLGHDYQMAAKEISKPFINDPVVVQDQGEDQNTCLANNMGLIHYAVRHYALAVRFFQQALNYDAIATKDVLDMGHPLYAVGATRRSDILYNLGIGLLYLQRPKEAFECLLIPLNKHHNNARLWLRLAEACIMVHNQNLKDKETKAIVTRVIGSGVHRKHVIQPTPHKYVSDEEQSHAIPSPNLEFASLCLRNALDLIDYNASSVKKSHDHFSDTSSTSSLGSNNGSKTTSWTNVEEGVQCNPSKPMDAAIFEKLKTAVLAAYSYVSICLGEYTLGLKYAKELLLMKNLPETHLMLGRMYCAEALIMMDRVQESLVFLDPNFIKDLKSDDFETRGSPESGWKVTSAEAAQSVLFYNLAVALIIHGEYEMAKTALINCTHPIIYPNLKMIKMYLELAAGNVEKCKMMIKYDTPQYM